MKVNFVAEVSSNHNRDLKRSKEFIEEAARIGCNGVKFQLFRIKELFAPEILEKSESHRKRKEWELPVEFIPELSDTCRKHKIEFSCTPFYLDAVDELKPYVDFFKIASYELLWTNLLVKAAESNLPIVLSTGMATIDEIDTAVNVIIGTGNKKLTLLHTVSGYPTPPEEANLNAIETLRNRYKCNVGWSDHTVNPAILYRAIHKWNASMIEFHLDLDRQGEEYKSGHCWLPDEIKQVIDNINTGFMSDGTGEKIPAPSEMSDREWRADPKDGLRPLMLTRKKFKT